MRLRLLVAFLVVVALGFAGWSWRDSSAPQPPLTAPGPEMIGFPITHLKTFGYGLPVITNQSDSVTAVIDRVVLVRLTPGLEVEAVYVHRLGSGGMSSAWEHWPPPARVTLASVKGFEVPPHSRSRWDPNFIFKLRADHLGRYHSTGLRIDYHVGGRHYTLFDPLVLRVCVVPDTPRANCY